VSFFLLLAKKSDFSLFYLLISLFIRTFAADLQKG